MIYSVQKLRHFRPVEAKNVSTSSATTSSLLAAVADLQITLDPTGVITHAESDSDLLELLPLSSVTGLSWLELIQEADIDSTRTVIETARSNPGVSSHVDLVLCPQGQVEMIPLSCWVCADAETDATYLIGMDLRSETSLKQQLVNAQRTLEQDYWNNRRLEARYRRMMEMMSDGFLVIDDLSGRVLEANSTAGILLGVGEDALVGRVFPVGMENSGSRAVTELQRESRSVTGMVTGEVVTSAGNTLTIGALCLRQGNETRLLVRIAPLSSNAAEIGISKDAFDHSPDGILVTDETGVVITANAAYLTLAGIHEESQAAGRRADRWLGRSNVDLNVMLGNVGTDSPLKLFSTVLRTETGVLIDVELSAVKAPVDDQIVIVMFIRDISRRINNQQTTDVHLPRSIEQITGRVGRVPLKQLVRESTDVIEALCVEAALKLTKDNRAAAAELLGLSRQSLYTKLKRFDIGDSEDEVA